MKNNKKQIKEFENLSAFLDDQLQPEEKAQLQARLSTDAELRQQLKDLDQTRRVLRSTPQIRRPRSFALTPEMVKQQRFTLNAMRFSRFVGVAATVLFAFVFASQMFFSRGMGFSAANIASDSVAVENQPEADFALEESDFAGDESDNSTMAQMADDTAAAAPEEPVEEPLMEIMESTPTETEMGMDDTQDTAAADEPMDDAADQDASPENTGGGGGEPPAESEAAPAALPTATIQSRTSDSDKSVLATEALGGANDGEAADAEDGPMLLVVPTAMSDEASKEPPAAPEQRIVEEEGTPRRKFQTIMLVEGILLGLAGLGAIFTLYFRRRLK